MAFSTVVKRIARTTLGVTAPTLLKKLDVARTRSRYLQAPVRGPRLLQLEATTGCNHRCLMCTDHSSLLNNPTPTKMMPGEQIERLLQDAAAMGTEEVWLAGRGEPLVHPQAAQTIRLATSLGMRSMITTNAGRLSDALADELCEAGLSTLSISINSACPETYALVHGAAPEERARILALMRRIAQRPKRPHLFTSMVLLKPNIAEMVDFVKEAIASGVYAVDILGLRGTQFFPTLALDEDDWDKVRSDLVTARALAQAAGVALLAHCIPAPTGENAAPAARPGPSHWTLGCYLGHVFTRVDVEGNLHGCCACSNYLGNAIESSFTEAWHAPAYQDFRQICRRMPATHQTPTGCDCEGCGNAMDNAVVFREIGFRPIRSREENQFATRLDLARRVWRQFGRELPGGEEVPGYADLTPEEVGAAWPAVVGLYSAGVMQGLLVSGSRREFRPHQITEYTEVAEVLRRCLALLKVPTASGERLIASKAPECRAGDPLLTSKVASWVHAVRSGLAKSLQSG